MSTKQTGDLSEISFVAWCLEKGLGVALPFGDRHPYDVIVDVGGRLIKVQVKTGWYRYSGVLAVAVTNTTTENGKWVYQNYIGRADRIVARDPETKIMYVFRPDDLGEDAREIHFRLRPTKNKQKVGVRFAVDYELTSVDQLL